VKEMWGDGKGRGLSELVGCWHPWAVHQKQSHVLSCSSFANIRVIFNGIRPIMYTIYSQTNLQRRVRC